MNTQPSPAPLAHAGMLLRTLIVGLSFPLVSALGDDLPLNLLTALRFFVALLATLPFLPRRTNTWQPVVQAYVLYWLMGACLAAFFATQFWVAQSISSVSMASLFVSAPLFTFVIASFFRLERINFRLLSLLVAGATGALLLVRVEASAGAFTVGAVESAYLLGCVALALHPVLSNWGLSKGWLSSDAATRSAWSLLTAAVLMTIVGLLQESPVELLRLSGSDLLILFYLGVFSSGLTFWLSQRAVPTLSPTEIMAYSYLVPLVSLLLLLASEPSRLSWHWLPGIALVLYCTCTLLTGNHGNRPVSKAELIQSSSSKLRN
ncbi:MAG: DMT family transporter [Pseudomonadales bacterium]|nr:DMT family transporter [Pseudomonadales bacterium]